MSLEDIRLVERTGSADNEREQLNKTISAIKELIPASGDTVTSSKIGNWDLAFSWGDHAAAGYLLPSTNAVISGNWDFTNGLESNGNPVVEETGGFWTPVVYGTTTAGSHTYGSQTGQWKRQGDLMFIDCVVQITTYDATMAGELRISGLPVASTGDRTGIAISYPQFGSSITLPGDFQQVFGWVNGSEIRFMYMATDGSLKAYPVSATSNFLLLRFSAVYPVA